jgi:hypothetical protein
MTIKFINVRDGEAVPQLQATPMEGSVGAARVLFCETINEILMGLDTFGSVEITKYVAAIYSIKR